AKAMRCHRDGYCATELYAREPLVKEIVDMLINGFLPAGRDEFALIHDSLMAHNDEYLVLKDFLDYAETQNRLEQAYRDKNRWLKMSIENIAYAGQFSSDRTISGYAEEIWGINAPVPAAAGWRQMA
ncbi:MAG: glycogen/starch/alpha-glucan phosphorylase, partial [Firmicutes bacterium]|nr:glycogen/starch/alpha-glucan phosphorylase [Bacillota bacterium]